MGTWLKMTTANSSFDEARTVGIVHFSSFDRYPDKFNGGIKWDKGLRFTTTVQPSSYSLGQFVNALNDSQYTQLPPKALTGDPFYVINSYSPPKQSNTTPPSGTVSGIDLTGMDDMFFHDFNDNTAVVGGARLTMVKWAEPFLRSSVTLDYSGDATTYTELTAERFSDRIVDLRYVSDAFLFRSEYIYRHTRTESGWTWQATNEGAIAPCPPKIVPSVTASAYTWVVAYTVGVLQYYPFRTVPNQYRGGDYPKEYQPNAELLLFNMGPIARNLTVVKGANVGTVTTALNSDGLYQVTAMTRTDNTSAPPNNAVPPDLIGCAYEQSYPQPGTLVSTTSTTLVPADTDFTSIPTVTAPDSSSLFNKATTELNNLYNALMSRHV